MIGHTRGGSASNDRPARTWPATLLGGLAVLVATVVMVYIAGVTDLLVAVPLVALVGLATERLVRRIHAGARAAGPQRKVDHP